MKFFKKLFFKKTRSNKLISNNKNNILKRLSLPTLSPINNVAANPTLKQIQKEKNELIKLNSLSPYCSDEEIMVFYISDLHIDMHISKIFKLYGNEQYIDDYVHDITRKLINSIEYTYFKQDAKSFIVVFAGDISKDFQIFCKFFNEFVYYFKRLSERYYTYQPRVFFIAGNHEIGENKNKSTSVESHFLKYKKYLEKIDVIFLQNQLFLLSIDDKFTILSADQILSTNTKKLNSILFKSKLSLFGGVGFAGLNSKFNSNMKLYFDAPMTREKEIKESEIVAKIHKKLSDASQDCKILFITHMPKKDWTLDKYSKNLIYISGHTHKNKCINSADIHCFEDNQIGYKSEKILFHYIPFKFALNIFANFKNGIYEISKSQYEIFYQGVKNSYAGISRNFERFKIKKIFLIKKDKYYCFMVKNDKYLMILNGGVMKKLENQSKSLNYYYENLENYAKSIKNYISKYSDFQKKIAYEVRKIGGEGKIHGAIVDIDFFNHLYINPLDSSITPYFAYAINDKYVYQNIVSLLKYKRKDLYDRLLSNKTKFPIILQKNWIESPKNIKVVDTQMYKMSRIIKGLQGSNDLYIVKIWNDSIVNKSKKLESSGKQVLLALMDTKE